MTTGHNESCTVSEFDSKREIDARVIKREIDARVIKTINAQ